MLGPAFRYNAHLAVCRLLLWDMKLPYAYREAGIRSGFGYKRCCRVSDTNIRIGLHFTRFVVDPQAALGISHRSVLNV